MRTHLNSAGAALVPAVVRDTVLRHLNLEAEIGGYEAADAMADDIGRVYHDVAALVGANVRNVAVTASATTAFVQALSSLDFHQGDVILTSRSDYTSYQIHYLALAKRAGVRVIHVPDGPNGGIDPQAARELLRRESRVRLVSVSWLPTHSGIIQDVAAVGVECREAGVPYHVDACQAVGQLPIDFESLHCDYLSATARKFLRGPRGVGFLVASDHALERGDYPIFVDMRGAEWVSADDFAIAPTARRYEDWEFAYALVLGLGASIRYAMAQGIEETGILAHEHAQYLRTRLAVVPGVRVLDPGPPRSAIVTFDAPSRDIERLNASLRARHISVVLTRKWFGLLDFGQRGVEVGIRASPHYYNTIDELDLLVDAVAGEFAT